MDKKDKVFLAHLRENARKSLTDISKQTKIPISTLYDRLKNLRKNIINKHTTLIDFTMMGYLCKANIIIKVDIEDRESAKEYLLYKEEVNSLFKINNGYDFLIEGIFRHVKEMEDFMDLFERKFKILAINVYYVIEDIKRETFIANLESVI
ncbi:hypothetical protein CMO90_04475 [Candidatus Woesearchaeota archaeon]|jgi:DNA-binding Lrp family transcriptional regulator|nr:hypothetical protein [Candidatus Woesearchaeota archaeon]|tara:strand:- start:378 stop:830 length:453 start_codon:yes stop_codon:yes gene_type:complete